MYWKHRPTDPMSAMEPMHRNHEAKYTKLFHSQGVQTRDKEKYLRKSRSKIKYYVETRTYRITTHSLLKATQMRRQWNTIFKQREEKMSTYNSIPRHVYFFNWTGNKDIVRLTEAWKNSSWDLAAGNEEIHLTGKIWYWKETMDLRPEIKRTQNWNYVGIYLSFTLLLGSLRKNMNQHWFTQQILPRHQLGLGHVKRILGIPQHSC